MRLFKRCKILALLLASILLLAGCGGNDAQKGNGAGGESQGNENVVGENREDASSNEEELPGEDEDASAEEQNSGNDEKNYPVIEVADYSDLPLEGIENDQIACAFPVDEWIASDEIPGQLQIFWEETIGTGQAININISLASASKVPANYDWIEDMLSQLEDGALEGFAITVESIEPRLLEGETVVYAELVTQITDEMIDLMIDQGVYTEEQIASAGGREVLLSIPPTTQISITAERDGYLYTCTGTYYDQEQKQMVLDTMAIVIGTVEKL